MMEIITGDLIDLNINVKNKIEAIEFLANKINDSGRLENYENYYASVIERETLTTTGIGFGIAIPHGKSPWVKETTVAFGRLNTEVDWQSLDGNKVKLVFLLAVPEQCKGDQHLKIIASLSRKLIHQDFRETLQNATCEEDIVNLLTESLAAAVA